MSEKRIGIQSTIVPIIPLVNFWCFLSTVSHEERGVVVILRIIYAGCLMTSLRGVFAKIIFLIWDDRRFIIVFFFLSLSLYLWFRCEVATQANLKCWERMLKTQHFQPKSNAETLSLRHRRALSYEYKKFNNNVQKVQKFELRLNHRIRRPPPSPK